MIGPAPRAVPALALACAAGLTACAGGPRQYAARPGPHDQLGEVLPAEVLEVQRLRDEGQLETARAWAERLAQRQPANVPLAMLVQDVEIELGGDARGEELRRTARQRAEREQDLPSLLLAARLERDPVLAEALLGRALELEPGSAWPAYALAHLEAREGRWAAASQRLERALLIDPGHLWARRLETQLSARGGDRDEAVEGLERWIVEASASPFFRRRDLDAARLDLVQLHVLEERPARAEQVLEQVAPQTLGSARAQELVAAIRQAQGDLQGALEAIRAAQAAAGDEALALVQQAVLMEEWLRDPAAALATWRAVLTAASRRSDLGGLLLALRARAAIERLEVLVGAQAEGA